MENTYFLFWQNDGQKQLFSTAAIEFSSQNVQENDSDMDGYAIL
jgi:hypothetical protein